MKAGLDFEKFVEGVIREGLHQRSEIDGTEVRSGLGKAEYGKDIVVEISHNATIIGIPLVNPSKDKLSVAVECKYVGENNAMSLQNFAANILQNINKTYDHYILVTNGFLSAKATYELHNQFKGKSQTKVWLVDAPLLQREIQELNLKKFPAKIEIHEKETEKNLSKVDDVVCHLEIEAHDKNSQQSSDILVALRNMSTKPRQGVVRLQSRDGLETETIEYTFNLDPFGIDSCKFSLKRDLADTPRQIQLGLEIGTTIEPLYRLLPASVQLDLGLPLLGAGHQEACERLASAFNAYAENVQMCAAGGKGVPHLLVASITGPTGTGKSHLLRELLNKRNLHPFASFTYVFGRRADAVEAECRRSRLSMPSLPSPATAGNVIDAFLTAETFGSSIPLLLLEDTHLADDDTCQKLATIIKGDVNISKAAVILIIGRTDFRFGSSEAARLLMSLKAKASLEGPIPDSSPNVTPPAWGRAHVQVDALDQDGFEAMTREVLQDATPGTLKVIEQLSGRVPHHVLQCIEWLMDMTALRVKYRPEIGIFNTRLFNQRLATLPPNMASLLTDRFNILGDVEHGARAQLIVAAAALLGTKLPAALLSLGLDGAVHEPVDAAEVKLLLRERRLLVQTDDGTGLRWHHENLLTHMRNWLLNWDTPTPCGGGADREANAPTRAAWEKQGSSWARKAAKALIARDDLWADLPPEDQGLIAALAKQHGQAVSSWRAMLTMAEAANGYSTTDLDNRHFPYLRWLYTRVQTQSGPVGHDGCDGEGG